MTNAQPDIQSSVSPNTHAFASQLEQDAYTIVSKIDKLRVGHKFFETAMVGIRECMKASELAREPVNCMLLGEGGMGKTSVAEMLVRAMPPEIIVEDSCKIRTVPAFYTSFKSNRNLDALTSHMLLKLGDPNPKSGKVDDKADRVLELLIRCRTKIVFIDELHDLDGFEDRNYKAMQRLLKWIKAITNGGGPMTCLMGIENCQDLFDGDPEMARRFKRKFLLKRLAPGTQEKPGYLQGFLRDIYGEISAGTPIKSFPETSYIDVLRIWAATKGSLDFTMTLIKESALRALMENRAYVDISDFSEVWEQGSLNGGSKVRFNPFTAQHAVLASAVRENQI